MIQAFRNFTNSQISDSANQRRSKLLNILLLGITATTFLALLLLSIASLLKIFNQAAGLIGAILVMIVGLVFCFWLNHHGKVLLASSIFLALITLVFAFADTPTEVVKGRTLFMFVIPILMASFLVRPYASFIMTAFISALHGTLAYLAPVTDFTPIGLIGFLVIALVAWLAARNLETALLNLQEINQGLDQRVNDRTRELAGANDLLKFQTLELASNNSLLEQQAHDLASANDRLKDLDTLKSKFVSDVSHELRTPISNLLIYLEMMEAGNQEKNERYLNVLRDEASRLQKLVTDVLNISRMETGSGKVEFQWIDLNEIGEKVVLANQVRAEAKKLAIQYQPEQALPTVWGVADQLNQVINNLVGNAINYTADGCIEVNTWLDTEQQRVGLRVKDTGFGITDLDISHVFERFYRGEHAGQSAIPGTGLGLAITKEIMTQHNGSIEVESTVGQGSTFTIYLPVQADRAARGSKPGE